MTSTRFNDMPRTANHHVHRVFRTLATLLNQYDDEVQASLELKALLAHTHDDKADSVHTHDDRYYTETEADTLLDAKQALHALLTDIAGLTLAKHDLLTHDGNNIVVLAAPLNGAGDKTLTYNDTTKALEWS